MCSREMWWRNVVKFGQKIIGRLSDGERKRHRDGEIRRVGEWAKGRKGERASGRLGEMRGE